MEIRGLGMIGTLGRVLMGYGLACLTAGVITVLFLPAAAELATVPANAFPEQAAKAGTLALVAATQYAMFGIPFVLIATVIGEWLTLRNFYYYLMTGMVIAVLGYAAQYHSEVPGQPTIFNSYALMTFLTAGFIAGITYWLTAGQFAGGRKLSTRRGTELPDKAKDWKQPKILVEDEPARDKKSASLSEPMESAEADVRIMTPVATKSIPQASSTSVPTTKAAEPRPNPAPKAEVPKGKDLDPDKDNNA